MVRSGGPQTTGPRFLSPEPLARQYVAEGCSRLGLVKGANDEPVAFQAGLGSAGGSPELATEFRPLLYHTE